MKCGVMIANVFGTYLNASLFLGGFEAGNNTKFIDFSTCQHHVAQIRFGSMR